MASLREKTGIEHHNVRQVFSIQPSHLHLKFLKWRGEALIWPTQGDFDCVEERNILMTLSESQIDPKGSLKMIIL